MTEDHYTQQFFSEVNTRLRDSEEKQRLLKERLLLIGQNLVDEREKTFKEIQEMKREVLVLKEENLRMKEILKTISDHASQSARKEELMILQRQFDMFKPNIK